LGSDQLWRALCCRRGEGGGGGGGTGQGSPRRRNPQWDSCGGHAEFVEADVAASRCEDWWKCDRGFSQIAAAGLLFGYLRGFD